jgi:outer membrane protein assembly factor BamB
MISRRHFLAGVGAGSLAAVAGCLSGSAPSYSGGTSPKTNWWPQPQFDAINSCYNPRSVGPRSGVRERWHLDISGPAARPVVADGLAFLPTSAAVRAVDVQTGTERWREDGGDPPMWPRSVLWHDGLLYVACPGDELGLLALNAKTGERQWSFTPAGDGLNTLSLNPEFSELFAGDNEGNVYQLDPATGTTQWHRRIFGAVTVFTREVRNLLVGTAGGEVYALDPADGSGSWRRKFPGRISVLTAMNGSYRGAGAFVSVLGGPTVAINSSQTGTTTWTSDVWGAGSFVLSGQTLFAADTNLVALAVGTGERRWTGGQTAHCGPAAAGDTVYAASADHVTAYEFGGGIGIGSLRVGAKRWFYPVEGRPEQGFAVADGAVFVLTEGGENTSSRAYALEEA